MRVVFSLSNGNGMEMTSRILFLHEEQLGIDFPPYLVIHVSFPKWIVEGSLYKLLTYMRGT